MNIKENIKTLIIEKPLKLDCGQALVIFHWPMKPLELLMKIKIMQF